MIDSYEKNNPYRGKERDRLSFDEDNLPAPSKYKKGHLQQAEWFILSPAAGKFTTEFQLCARCQKELLPLQAVHVHIDWIREYVKIDPTKKSPEKVCKPCWMVCKESPAFT